MECAIPVDLQGNRLESRMEVMLCKFATGEKIRFHRAYGSASTMGLDGKYALTADRDLTLYNMGNFGDLCTMADSYYFINPGVSGLVKINFESRDKCPMAIQIAISPDENYALVVTDKNLEVAKDSLTQDPQILQGIEVYLVDLRMARILVYCPDPAIRILSTRITQGKYIRHIGFLEDSQSFFICSDQFYIYSMENFAPRGGLVPENKSDLFLINNLF